MVVGDACKMVLYSGIAAVVACSVTEESKMAMRKSWWNKRFSVMHIRRCAAGMVRVREQEDFNISMALYKETREIPIIQLLALQVPFMHPQDYGKTMLSRNHEQVVGGPCSHRHTRATYQKSIVVDQ